MYNTRIKYIKKKDAESEWRRWFASTFRNAIPGSVSQRTVQI